MVGQVELQKLLTKDSLPHAILLIGDKGCGKHSFASLIANKLNCEVEDITENITSELLAEVSLRPLITLCLVDLNQITEKEQNVLLKSHR